MHSAFSIKKNFGFNQNIKSEKSAEILRENREFRSRSRTVVRQSEEGSKKMKFGIMGENRRFSKLK